MNRIIAVLILMSMAISLLWAQGIDESFMFMDEAGNIIDNGATVVRNTVEADANGGEFINSGISVLNLTGSNDDYIKLHYVIERIDNGTYQIVFRTTCNMQTEVGTYETGIGQLMSDLQDIQSVWFPTNYGECIVTLTIELFTKEGLFPPSYVHKGWGPTLTLKFVKSSSPSGDSDAYVQLADGVFMVGTMLYIASGVASLGNLRVNPSEIFCYATTPPACLSNTFTGYDAILHVPAAGMVSYFTTQYWCNFNNILSDAIEPLSVTMNTADAELEIGQQLSLSATVTPNNATPKTVYWSSTDESVATVSDGGMVTAVATGECDIIATCVDKVAVCHVTVVNPRVTITLDKHEARLLPNHTITLTATCSPFNVDLAVISSNPGVALPRLVNGTIMVVGVTEGIATITVNAADGWSNPDSCVVTVYTEHGDVNCDGYVNISDVTDLIDYLLSGNDSSVSHTNADCDKDGIVNIADVTTLIDFLLSGWWPWHHDPNDYVDLGLPSGTLWATCNVGANSRLDYGDYFAWGETEPKEVYSWETYKWCNGTSSTLTKYCTNSSYGMVDNKTELDPEDDAAYVNWGPMWRMPTKEQQQELFSNCSWIQAVTYNGNGPIYGYLVTGPNGNSLFLPAGGYRILNVLSDTGSHGSFWSSTLYSNSGACILYFNSTNYKDNHYGNSYRHYGRSVRAVRATQN